jgi:hypothetical protein
MILLTADEYFYLGRKHRSAKILDFLNGDRRAARILALGCAVNALLWQSKNSLRLTLLGEYLKKFFRPWSLAMFIPE